MKVGVFDSGLGGLSVLRELLHRAPHLDVQYYADQARTPWGPRPAEEIRRYCHAITDTLVQRGCERIVVACNTASAVALQSLREDYPALPFVGMEPAIKPAAQLTKSGIVALLATPATLAGELLANTRARHAAHIEIVSDPCSGLVEAIESGDTPRIRAIVERIIPPLVDAGADTLVLGCTHYPFARDLIAEAAGANVTIVDPAPAVIAQLLRLLPEHTTGTGTVRYATSATAAQFETGAKPLLGYAVQAESCDFT